MSAADDAGGLTALLEHLKASRGFDFTGYKRASLQRRIQKRMELVGCGSYAEYLDFLEVHPDEFSALFNTILINVTGFFRDRSVWDHLRSEVVPRIAESKGADEPIRVWSAGGASGEEGYSAAMLFADVLGDDALRGRVKVYATDVDEEALQQARLASYSAREIEGVDAEVRERFFERSAERYTFRQDLRRSVIFGRNDLVQDAPISRIDLLICRNTLMYFNADTQAEILRRFHFALDDDGYLVLGKSEMLATRGDLFTPVDLKLRVFAKLPRAAGRARGRLVGDGDDHGAIVGGSAGDPVLHAAFDGAPTVQIVLDRNGTLALWNHEARALFGLTANDAGRPLQDLELSYRPVELRPSIERALAELRPVLAGRGHITRAGDARVYEASAAPLTGEGGALLGVRLSFHDVTRAERLQEEADRARNELDQAYEELQSTVEELETTNEELQSTNEELETTNEELQSTNEELETMNEELQSSNEQLEAMNQQLRGRTLELNRVNDFMRAILTSLGPGVVVLDRDLRVQVWNASSAELWGLRDEEAVDSQFLNLDIGLPVDRLSSVIRACMAGKSDREELTLDAVNRRGKAVRCEVACVPLQRDGDRPDGVILLMEAAER